MSHHDGSGSLFAGIGKACHDGSFSGDIKSRRMRRKPR
jgi:hypothetical protein